MQALYCSSARYHVLRRTSDGSQQWAQFRFAAINTVGAYQPTPNQTAALYPQLAGTNTWVTPKAADFVPQQFANLTYAQVCLKSLTSLLLSHS